MALTRKAQLVATSNADDLSLRALADVANVTDDLDGRIVGGQMVAILLTAFAVPDLLPRRTRDADAAISTEVAGSGSLYDRLVAHGYTPTAGNSYSKRLPRPSEEGAATRELSIDLLVPSFDGKFREMRIGGRAFDSIPGLALALAAGPILIETGATLLDGTVLTFCARVPTVEGALVAKAHAYASRRQATDVEDIYRLLEIVDRYPAEQIGGWQMNDAELHGSRKDAAEHLHELGKHIRRLTDVDVPRTRLATLIAAHVRRPA